MNYFYVGLLANIVMAASVVPSLYHINNIQNLDAYSMCFIVLMLFGNILWIIYGYGVNANMTMWMGILFLVYYSITLYWKVFLDW